MRILHHLPRPGKCGETTQELFKSHLQSVAFFKVIRNGPAAHDEEHSLLFHFLDVPFRQKRAFKFVVLMRTVRISLGPIEVNEERLKRIAGKAVCPGDAYQPLHLVQHHCLVGEHCLPQDALGNERPAILVDPEGPVGRLFPFYY